MDNRSFFTRFGALHDQFARGRLPPDLRQEYDAYCASLTHMMVCAQRMSAAKVTQRGDLRMAKIHRLHLELPSGTKEKTSTVDLGQTGFAARIAAKLDVPSRVRFVLHLPRGPIEGTALLVSLRAEKGAHRASFEFADLAPAARDALHVSLVDSVLERLRGLLA